MTDPTPDERREAVRIARELVAEYESAKLVDLIGTDAYDVCRTLLAAQHAFAERLAPVYEAAMAAFNSDGSLVGNGTYNKLRDVVVAVKRMEASK